MKTASWIIVEIATGKAVLETYNSNIIKHLKAEYRAVPILEYLTALNRKIKEADEQIRSR